MLYSSYNMYQNYESYPAFRGATTANVSTPSQHNAGPQLTQQPDTVTLSASDKVKAKMKKLGLSKEAIWGIGGVVVLGLGALAYVLTKGRAGSKQVQQLAEHVDFSPAKTIDEARTFANKTLNVQYLHENKANLDMINTVNEWLYREKVVAKKNIPDFVYFVEKDIDNPLGLTNKIYYGGKVYNALQVNVNYISRFDDFIEYVLNPTTEQGLSRLIRRNSKGMYEVVKPEYRCDNLDKLIRKLNAYNKNSSYKDKMEIYDGFSEAIPYLNNILAGKNVKMADFAADGPFIHEMGHLLHQDTYEFYNEAGKETSKIYQDFQLPDKQKIAEKVSSYATSSPLEFVAETYKRLRRGQTLSDDVMALYKKYKGPSIS